MKNRLQATLVELGPSLWEYSVRKGKEVRKELKRASSEHDNTGISDPTYLSIAKTSIVIDAVVDHELPGPVELNVECMLRKDESRIVVCAPLDSKIRKPLGLLTLEFNEAKQQELIAAEVAVLNAKHIWKGGFLKHEQRPHLNLQIEGSNLRMELRYHIVLIESLYLDFPPIFNTHLRPLFETYITTREPTDSNFTSKLFYDTITKSTSEHSMSENVPFVDGLGADLLPFQGTTVKWLLSKEGMTYNESTHSVEPLVYDNELDLNRVQSWLNAVVYGFTLIQLPFFNEKIWYNRYNNNICSQSRALKFLKEQNSVNAAGLLCEEMGLGKTVEILSLALLNKRAETKGEEASYFDADKNKPIRRAKTSLIICPESILSQWVEEVDLHAPGLKIMIYKGLNKYKKIPTKKIVDMISECDIVVTSYATLQREVHNAVYDPSKSKRLRSRSSSIRLPGYGNPEYFEKEDIDKLKGMYTELGVGPQGEEKREDYTSPLVLIQFWRLILDEVQMVGNTVGNICRIATIIPRVHSWGVSGTPIKKDVNDLASLVAFLRVLPFSQGVLSWKKLIANTDDLLDFFKGISFRHTKESVSKQIKLPPQQKVLLQIPFGPVEQNNYEELYRSFLNEVQLDAAGNPTVDDWEASPSFYEKMRNWLKILRRISCHANLGIEKINRDLGSTSFGYETIDQVLMQILETSMDRISYLEREIHSLKIDKGLCYELDSQFQEALEAWSEDIPKIEDKISEIREEMKRAPSEKLTNVLRAYLEILHRSYFFVAAAHHQIVFLPPEDFVPGIREQLLGEIEDLDHRDYLREHPQEIDYSQVVVQRPLNKDESEHVELEAEYYSKAQTVRLELLSEPVAAVEEFVAKAKNPYRLPMETIHSYQFNSLEVSSFAFRVTTTVNQINIASDVLNQWNAKLASVLSTPLLDSRSSNFGSSNGEEYASSLEEQTVSSSYLEYIQKLMETRNKLLNGSDAFSSTKTTISATVGSSSIEADLKKELPDLTTHFSLKFLLIESRRILNEEVVDHNWLTDFVLQVKHIYDEEVKVNTELIKTYRIFNDLYNKKIVYYKQLQQISDSLTPLTHDPYTNISYRINHLNNSIQSRIGQIATTRTRIKYLTMLSNNDGDMDKICVICRSEITVGSLIQCGHKYCKECLSEWLGTNGVKKGCPMCNQIIHPADIYHFTLNKDVLSMDTLTLYDEGDTASEEELFQVYHKVNEENLGNINTIKINQNYGSKINTIVRQIIWLKAQDPDAQIVIYSQWTLMLQILSKALEQNHIKFLGSGNTLNSVVSRNQSSSLRSELATFKKDPSITCFLLNAKADASGLNLINATHVFICEPLIQAALELQAISRIHRIGQTKPTTIWMFLISGSVEESIMLLSTRKKMKEKEKLDTEELSKSTKTLVNSSGEVVDNRDLWNAFFSKKINTVS